MKYSRINRPEALNRMMREIPNFDKRIIMEEERECPLCKYWDDNKCCVSECPYFD